MRDCLAAFYLSCLPAWELCSCNERLDKYEYDTYTYVYEYDI